LPYPYKAIHAAPELSDHEERTAALGADELRRLGFVVVEHLGRYERPEFQGHGVAGVLRNGEGKVVLIRAELDALPIEDRTGLPYASKVKARADDGQQVGVMHACGHDVHLTCMLGLARVLAQRKDCWRGTIVLVGEPAEETLDGVRALLRDDLYRKVPKPDFIFGVHTIGHFGLDRQVPLCLCFLGATDPERARASAGTGRPLPATHSPLYAPPPELTIRTGVTVLTAGVLELLDGRDAGKN
jgi:amidohydrolase